MTDLSVPKLACPFPSAINPHAAQVNQATIEWIGRFHPRSAESVSRHILDANVGWLAARIHPDVPLNELQLISDWYAWMFLRDDQCDESELGRLPERLASHNIRFLRILQGAELEGEEDPLSLALIDLRDRLQEKVASTWMRRFNRHVKEYFDATIWEATNRARRIIPDIPSYMRMRVLTGGLNIDSMFIEISEPTLLPVEVHEHVVLKRLTQAANHAVCWANDIISLKKEMQRGDMHNLVLVLQSAHQVTLPRALEMAVEMHNAEIDLFIQLTGQLPAVNTVADKNLHRYIDGLRARVRGNLDWSFEAGRYGLPRGTTP